MPTPELPMTQNARAMPYPEQIGSDEKARAGIEADAETEQRQRAENQPFLGQRHQ